MELSVSYGLWKLNELRSETRVFPTFYCNFLIIKNLQFLSTTIISEIKIRLVSRINESRPPPHQLYFRSWGRPNSVIDINVYCTKCNLSLTLSSYGTLWEANVSWVDSYSIVNFSHNNINFAPYCGGKGPTCPLSLLCWNRGYIFKFTINSIYIIYRVNWTKNLVISNKFIMLASDLSFYCSVSKTQNVESWIDPITNSEETGDERTWNLTKMFMFTFSFYG